MFNFFYARGRVTGCIFQRFSKNTQIYGIALLGYYVETGRRCLKMNAIECGYTRRPSDSSDCQGIKIGYEECREKGLAEDNAHVAHQHKITEI